MNSRAKRPQMNGEAYITETNVKGRKVTSGLSGWIFLYSAQFSFSWPRVDLARLPRRAYSRSVWIIYILRVCQSLWDSFLYLGKLYWFLYLLLSYFYYPGMFIFRWSSNFVGKVVLNESVSAKMASRVSYLICYYCI